MGQSSPVPAGTRYSISARQGDLVEIVLEGAGWLYLGSPDERGLEFLKREESPGKTVFRFEAEARGEYPLEFQIQDLDGGHLKRERVYVRVGAATTPAPRQTATPAPRPATAPASRPTASPAPERTATAPAARRATAEPGRGGSGGQDPGVAPAAAGPAGPDGLAGPGGRGGPEAADVGAQARRGEAAEGSPEAAGAEPRRVDPEKVRAAIGRKDAAAVAGSLEDLLAPEGLFNERDLLDASRLLLEGGRGSEALSLLREYLQRYPKGAGQDEAFFLLGRLYEMDGGWRDLKQARTWYGKVAGEFPESRYAEAATERVHYLNRHFFYIR